MARTRQCSASCLSALLAALIAAPPAAGHAVDPTRLPVGDRFIRTSAPGVGYAFVCRADNWFGGWFGGGAQVRGPWFAADGLTWDATAKRTVAGVVAWVSHFLVAVSGETRRVDGNGLPRHPTGRFPIAPDDPAFVFDRNPNTVAAQSIRWGLPAAPRVAATPTCLGGGAIGILLSGVRLFAPHDVQNRDAVAWEVQDSCQGHPEARGTYHYHSISSCLARDARTRDRPGRHSPLVGFAADGFGIYGNLGEGGRALTNADLDVCHGHSHAFAPGGAFVFHYHKTLEFPYALGCFRGAPVRVR